MLTYDNLLATALYELPDFKKKYENLLSEGHLDEDTGNHIIFSFVFVPLLVDAIEGKDNPTITRLLRFLEKMASSDDGLVVEVCDFTVLEELNDVFDLYKLYNLMGPKTREGVDAVKQYMN